MRNFIIRLFIMANLYLGLIIGTTFAQTLELVIDKQKASRNVIVEFSPDAKLILIGSNENLVLRDFENGKEKWKVKLSSKITTAKFSPDGSYLLIVCEDKTLELLDTATGNVVRTLRGQTEKVVDAGISPDGRTAVTVEEFGTTRIWDLPTGREKSLFEKGIEADRVAFSQDGNRVLTGSSNGELNLWNLTKQDKMEKRFSEHTNSITAVAFSQIPSFSAVENNFTVLSGSLDKTARLFDSNGKELIRLIHPSAVTKP